MNKLYNQLSEIERGKIAAYLKLGESISGIARQLNCSKPTTTKKV